MKCTKEYLNLRSQATQHRQRADDLDRLAERVKYKEVLELLGLKDKQIIKVGKFQFQVEGLEGSQHNWLWGHLVKQNGDVSTLTKSLYIAENRETGELSIREE